MRDAAGRPDHAHPVVHCRAAGSDVTDTTSALPGTGWAAELIVASSAVAPSTVTVTDFTERDAAR